jgi:hypothetical protein
LATHHLQGGQKHGDEYCIFCALRCSSAANGSVTVSTSHGSTGLPWVFPTCAWCIASPPSRWPAVGGRNSQRKNPKSGLAMIAGASPLAAAYWNTASAERGGGLGLGVMAGASPAA